MKEKIIAILNELRPEFDFAEEGINFIEEGMLDSFDIVSLVDSIETEIGARIPGAEILPESFATLDAVLATIQRNLK